MKAGRAPSSFKFIAVTYALTLPWWILSVFVRYSGLPDNLPITDAAATFMPALAAVLLTMGERQPGAVFRLLARSGDWRRVVEGAWWFVILGLPPAIYVATHLTMRDLGLAVPAHWSFSPTIVLAFLAFFFAAAGEEIGYTGYATDALLLQASPLRTALLLGLPWALWHLPSMIELGQSPGLIMWGLIATVAFRILYLWIYVNGGHSLFAIILFHALANTGRTAFPGGRAAFEQGDASIGYGLIIGITVLVVLACGPSLATCARHSQRRRP